VWINDYGIYEQIDVVPLEIEHMTVEEDNEGNENC